MNIKMIGLAVVVVGVALCVMFVDSYKYMIAALTVVVFGFLIALIGYLTDVKKQKIINERLDRDIETVIQPLITKYSNLNKQYSSQYSGEEYAKKRMELNQNLEKELTKSLPYLDSRQIKKIVINFSREQNKL
jgi:predicted signal transduction protein with EAL and GGDEF domain